MSNPNKDWLLYNASEYTLNGKVYRNLEAQVLRNKQLSEKNAEDIAGLDIEKIYQVTYGETSFEDIYDNWTQGHLVFCYYQGLLYILTVSTYNIAYFTNYRYIPQDTQVVIRGFRVDREEGYETPTQITTAASLNPLSDSSLPVAKAVADYVTDYVPDYVQSYITFTTGATDKYLREDGTWATPSGGGGSANVLKVSFTGTGTYTCDKTLAQILSAIANDYIVYAIVNGAFQYQLDSYGATDVSFRRTWGEDYDGGVGVDWYTQTITIQNVGGNDIISSETLTSHVLN